MKTLVLSLVLFVSIASAQETSQVSVQTPLGQINGYQIDSNGTRINVFLGIPFAEPPVGDLRFRKPNPIHEYRQPVQANAFKSACFQPNRNSSEDCLYLNVFAPNHNTSSNAKSLRPVLVWIHGGALTYGSGVDVRVPDVLVARGDLVLVTINYRLGSFGFFYGANDQAPGNQALWDQKLALEWVRQNIAAFGGDKDKVTVMGFSAGSFSLGLLILSPLTRNLFTNAVMMSGAPLNHRSGEHPKRALDVWTKAAKIVGCGDGSQINVSTISCLRQVEAAELAKLPNLSGLNKEPTGYIPLPVYGNEFLPERPLDMLLKGNHKKNFNLLTGTTDFEGWMIWKDGEADKDKFGGETFKMNYSQARKELRSMSERIYSRVPVNGDDIARFYFSTLPRSDRNSLRRSIGVAMGDFYIGCVTIQFAKLVANDNSTSVYQYYYTRKSPRFMPLDKCPKWMGACHGSDIKPIFGFAFRGQDYPESDKKHSLKMMDTIVHFVKQGSPPQQNQVDWPKFYTVNGQVIYPHFHFGNDDSTDSFGNNLKATECDIVWKTYIDNQ